VAVDAHRERIRDLPLGARIGSVVQPCSSRRCMRAAGDGSLITLPDAGDNRIVAVSQIR
jgi:hypothetical protein